MTASYKRKLGRGAIYIYSELMIASFSGYILWLVLSKISTPEVIGITATIVSLGAIFATIASLGIANGIPKYLGKMFSDGQYHDASLLTKSSIVLTLGGIAACSVAILWLKDIWILESLDFILIVLSILIMASSASSNLFRYIIISSLRTKPLVTWQLVGSIIRIVLAIILVLVGMSALGVTLAYAISLIVIALTFGFAVAKLIERNANDNAPSSKEGIRHYSRLIVLAGIPSWIPASITTVGIQLGTVIVFGAMGAGQAGTYFIAFSIFSAILVISSSMLSAAFPVLSAMTDGRKRFTWRAIKLSLIISLPLSAVIIFYSEQTLSLLGQDYVQGSVSLQILLLSILPSAFTTGLTILAYSYGDFGKVLILGLALSIPRTLLYFVLVPIFGGAGAAISYLVGSVVGLIISFLIAEKIKYRIVWKDMTLLFVIPLGIAAFFSYYQLHIILGAASTLLFSYMLFLTTGVLKRDDIRDSVNVLPFTMANGIIKISNKIGEKLNRSY